MKSKKNVFKIIGIVIFVVILLIVGIILVNNNTSSNDIEEGTKMEAPNFQEVSVHDPSIIKDENSEMFYVFGTHISGAKSTDLIEWENFTNGYTAQDNTLYGDLSETLSESFEWAGENDADTLGGYGVWAPEVIWNEDFENDDGTTGAYTIYYSVSSTYMRSAIGLASSKNIEGPYQYEDTIMYSGFLNHEGYDSNSTVNKHWENTNIETLISEGTIQDVNSEWFTDAGAYNTAYAPNAIDANILYDKEGNLWMTYGSWSGGTYILELDQNTGLPIYPGEDSETSDGRIIDRYFGTKIAAGYGRSAEGTYAIYDEETDYYYLFLTYGGLTADGGYQVRTFRSEDIDGPYVDASGQDAVFPESFEQGVGNFPGNADHMHIGNKIFGNFFFERQLGESGSGPGVGYLSPGHNSVYQDPNTNQSFLVFHTRFPDRGENHELRIHQMFMNEEGWPVVVPHRYAGEELETIDSEDVIGDYKYINHGKDILPNMNVSETIYLNEDSTISGEVQGTWDLKDENTIELTIEDETYSGVLIKQWDPSVEQEVLTFTALSDEGIAIWGSKTEDLESAEIVRAVADGLEVDENPTSNLDLPTSAVKDTQISWESSDLSIVNNEGIVNPPAEGDRPKEVTLTANIANGNETLTKEFAINFPSTETTGELVAHYAFDQNLSNSADTSYEAGVETGSQLDSDGGSISYVENPENNDYAAYFDGESGILLPDGLISSYNYTVSLWANPEQIVEHTTLFFGSKTENSWISLVPRGPIENTMIWSNNGSDWYDAPSGTTLPVDEWSHVAFTVEEGMINLYLNGENVFQGTDFPNIFNVDDASFSLGVNYWDQPYQGMMDELMIWDNVVLTEDEIVELSTRN